MAGNGKGRRGGVIDGSLLAMTVLCALLGVLAWWQGGAEQVRIGLGTGTAMLLRFALVIAVSFWAAGFAQSLIPRGWIETHLGAGSGVRGLVLASIAGVLTPSGPYVAMPLGVAMLRGGAEVAALVAYVSAWGLLALHRLIAWEVPLFGPQIALTRWLLCLALPIVAGLLARALTRVGALGLQQP